MCFAARRFGTQRAGPPSELRGGTVMNDDDSTIWMFSGLQAAVKTMMSPTFVNAYTILAKGP